MSKTFLTIGVPVILGLVAAMFNMIAVRADSRTVDLTVVKADVKAGTPLTEEMLQKMTVRVGPEVFRTAVRYTDRGVVIGRATSRPLAANEAVLLADVRLSGTFDVRANLQPGERSLTLTVKASRIVPGLRVGDEVEVVVSGGGFGDDSGDPAARGPRGARTLGPFRVVGLGDRADAQSGSARADERQVVIGYTGAGGADFAALERAYRGENNERVVGVEYSRDKPPAK